MLPLCVVVCGDPVPRTIEQRGGFADLIRSAAGETWPGPWLDFDARSGARAPDLDAVAALIVTGSASSVTSREPWILAAERYLAKAVERGLPVLGICFGHQLLGQALGGLVKKNPCGREMGSVELDVLDHDPLLGSGPRLVVNMSHQDSVVELPPGARVLGRTSREPHAAVRFAETAWGLQFHPEFDGAVMTDYLDARAQLLTEEGQDVSALKSAARDTPAGAMVLKRFAGSVLARRPAA